MIIKYDLTTLDIQQAIVHDIPKHRKDDFTISPTFSEQTSELTLSLGKFFKESIIKALARDRSFKICYNEKSDSPVNKCIKTIINDNEKFVHESKVIGQHLFNIQKGYNASGILFILQCILSGHKVCIIMKLERDDGARLTMNEATKSFDISEVRDLMLTSKTKVFKIALLVDRDNYGIDFDGDIMDYQINSKERKDLSSFFINDFLGCRPYSDPKVTTQAFYNLTTTFIKSTILDKIKQAKYLQDLNSYLQMNKQTLNPKEFSDDYFTTPFEQDEYKEFMKTKNFEFKSFPKDLSLIKSKIEKFMVSFKNGITILGSKGTFDDNVKLEELGNGDHQATIVSQIKNVK
ncbi:nucleoid-associated protein [Maribacter chungangensis]|uniref:Nucleoid-associated protein n=1 Tax=Maribacter chungangensis TaxID=1069117 RepID=A0ABW3B1H0_9FLAO